MVKHTIKTRKESFRHNFPEKQRIDFEAELSNLCANLNILKFDHYTSFVPYLGWLLC